MFQYEIFLILLVSTIGLCISLERSFEPERCCVPKQFSAKLTLLTGMILPDGSPYSLFAHYNFSQDQQRGMIGMKGFSTNVMDNSKSYLWIIQNTNTGITYTIDIEKKHCEKTYIQNTQMYCIPPSATYLYSSNYGYDDKQIIGDTWLIKMNDTVTYSTVSRNDCIPLTGYIYMTNPKLIDGLTTTDYVPYIVDPSVFDIPAECQKFI